MKQENFDGVGIGIILVEPGELLEGRDVGFPQAGSHEGVAIALALEMGLDPVEIPSMDLAQRTAEVTVTPENREKLVKALTAPAAAFSGSRSRVCALPSARGGRRRK